MDSETVIGNREYHRPQGTTETGSLSTNRRLVFRWEETMNQLDSEARRIIATALGEWYGGPPKLLQQMAEAIIARLADHKPPILLEMDEAEAEVEDTGPVCKKCRKQASAINATQETF